MDLQWQGAGVGVFLVGKVVSPCVLLWFSQASQEPCAHVSPARLPVPLLQGCFYL